MQKGKVILVITTVDEKAYFNSELSEGLRLNISASFMFSSFPADVRFICVNFRNTVQWVFFAAHGLISFSWMREENMITFC